MSNQSKATHKLDMEFWGILNFEMNLPALYQLLQLKNLNIGFNRFFYMVAFPNDLTTNMVESIWFSLENRTLNPKYQSLLQYEMNKEEEALHQLLLELFRLKLTGNYTSLYYLYQLPMDMFYHISTKLIEHRYVDSTIMNEIYSTYKKQ